ncbi:hypothetical protein U9M48_038573 [Paspalum notatum var. saurae]|uniref:No apical meristem-associated C-terminal domain-containing protein n=1 Tax=Paspalum notatum var. saurae TaxID=547442 RepID=A0AAQ3XC72_PASNO
MSTCRKYISVREQIETECGVDHDSDHMPHCRTNAKRLLHQRTLQEGGGGFLKAEDEVICSAFLNVSKDAITGVNQSSGGYYKRIHAYFNDHKPEGSNRSQIAIRNRWGLIQKIHLTRHANSFTSQINDAVKAYEKDEPFLFLHCWKLLRNEAKWNDKVLELNTSAAAVKGATTSEAPSVEIRSGQDKSEEPRPEGRDGAKRKRARGVVDEGSSTAVEVLQQLNDRNEKSEVKQEQQMEEILTLKSNKMKLGEKMYDLHKHDMEVRTKLKEEQLSLSKKDIEVREKQSEAQLLTAEVGIMGADLDKLAPQVRLYYAAMQRQILERRGINMPPNNDN